MGGSFTLRVSDVKIVVNMADQSYLLKQVEERMLLGTGFAVATLNLDHLVKLRRLGVFRQAYLAQDMVTADGNPIVWLSRLARRPVALVTGSDLVEPLTKLAGEQRVPVALLGATAETLSAAAGQLTARHPGLEIVALLEPSRNFDPDGEEASALIEALRISGAGMTFLALGAPKQEIFAARCRAAIPAMGLVSVGAGLDFIAMRKRRAPVWMQRVAMEWLWRILTDPRRLAGRYAQCAFVLPAMALESLRDGTRTVLEARSS
jgi:N-acetylglucosaminyldiphosphoundecaprenol N-acetyl-beta-D-mannosaminyltransferase